LRSIQNNPDYFEARPLILSDRTGELIIIAGNQRFDAANHLKIKEIPTYLLKDLSKERELEIIVRDNISNGTWNWDELNANWDVEELEDWGLDIPDFDDVEDEEPKEQKDISDSIESSFRVEVELENELEQEKLYSDLSSKGYICRILTL